MSFRDRLENLFQEFGAESEPEFVEAEAAGSDEIVESASVDSGVHHLELYVSGCSRHSAAAVRSVKQVCEGELKGCYRLKIIDILKDPAAARQADVIVTPTLIARTPLVEAKSIGKSIFDPARLRAVLMLDKYAQPAKPKPAAAPQPEAAAQPVVANYKKTHRLYIVEDKRSLSEALEPMLYEAGIAYRWFGDAREAIETLLALDPVSPERKPVVIFDIGSEEMNLRKLDALLELRADSFELVLVNPNCVAVDHAHVERLGAAVVLEGAIDAQNLFGLVRKLISLGSRDCPYCGQKLAKAPKLPEASKVHGMTATTLEAEEPALYGKPISSYGSASSEEEAGEVEEAPSAVRVRR